MEGVKGVRLQLPSAGAAAARRKEARAGTGADDPDLRGVRASPSELRGQCWAAPLRSRERCAQPQADARGPPGPRSRPAHRHGRRVQWEALVVVVPGPVQRVLQLRPRTPLGLTDPLLALVVHPAGSPPAGSATTSAQLASCHQCAAPLPAHTHTQTRATAGPRRPSLRPGAFKVAFQKIHSLTTFRASGWTSGCRLPPDSGLSR